MKTVPKELKRLLKQDGTFKLTKLAQTNKGYTMVFTGECVTGELSVVESEKGGFCVKVYRTPTDYIRTSLVQEVVDSTKKTLIFTTLNSVYSLEKL